MGSRPEKGGRGANRRGKIKEEVDIKPLYRVKGPNLTRESKEGRTRTTGALDGNY